MNPRDGDPLTAYDDLPELWDKWLNGDRPGGGADRTWSYPQMVIVYPRRPWRIVAALLAVGLLAFAAGRVSAAPRPASAPSIPVAAQARTGAPDVLRQPVIGSSLDGAPLTGTASWYPASGLIAAAGPPLRHGDWRGRYVTVTANGRSVVVRISDWCQCPRRLIDLSDDAFRRLAPLSRGLVQVRVSVAGPTPTVPSTDTR